MGCCSNGWMPLLTLVLSSWLLLLVCMVGCDPPPDPVHCTVNATRNCTVTNAYGVFPDRSTCKAADVSYPSSEAELVGVVASATVSRRKVKVTTRHSHSFPKLVCPDGEDAMLISTNKLNRVLSVDEVEGSIVVESGVLLRELIAAAAKAGMALPYAPYWWGITVGGLLSTGSHGSTLWGGSSVHDHVLAVRIVTPAGPEDGFAKVREIDEGNPVELNAVKVSLGVLGVISQVKLKLQPMFKRSLTYSVANDTNLGDEVISFGRKHEFADIFWYPSQQKAIYRLDDRVDVKTKGDGRYDFIPFRDTSSLLVYLLKVIEETQETTNDASGKCIQGKLFTSSLLSSAFGLTNNGVTFTGYPVVGYQNNMQSSGSCLDSPKDALLTACEWDPRLKGELFFQTAFSVSLQNVTSFIRDIQALVKLEPESLCGLDKFIGIWMRYVKASSAYLGKEADSVDFDVTFYRSKDPMTPRMFEDVLEEIEQMAVFKYGALPHWGKNRNVAFAGVIEKYGNHTEFLKVKDEYDPSGLFSSGWTNKVLGIDREGVMIERDGCALEGLCVCSTDSHCAPGKGYYCRPGKVYKDARVCRKV